MQACFELFCVLSTDVLLVDEIDRRLALTPGYKGKRG